jgi:hypothetical protein
VLKSYGEREKTRFERLWEIRAADRWREFAEVEDELGEWIGGRPKALFDASVGWLEIAEASGTPGWTRCGGLRRRCPARR